MNEGLPSEIVDITTSFITSNSIQLSWISPNSVNSIITYYNIYKSIYSNSVFLIDSSSNTTTSNIINLLSNTTYYIKVSAVNTNGEELQSTVIIQSTLPENVGLVTATKGNRLVNLSWNVVSGNTQIVGYLVEKSTDSILWTDDILLNPTTSYTSTNLDNGILYYFRVSARNNVGIGMSSDIVSAIPSIVSDEPQNITTISRNMTTPILQVIPINNGDSAIITYTLVGNPNLINNQSYVFTVTANNKNGSSLSSPQSNVIIPSTIPNTITGNSNIINGTPYTFNVTANNINGSSERSIQSNLIIPSTIPDAPTTITGVSENSQVIVSWIAPINNGGTIITSYIVTSNPGGLTATTLDGTITTTTVTGLTNGISYTFTVIATNINGNSLPSTASSDIIPSTVPNKPTDVFGIPGNTEATIYWSAPLFNGGSAITSYTITSNPGGITKTITGSSSTTRNIIDTNIKDIFNEYNFTTFPNLITIPDAPTQITCTLGNTIIDLSWNIPNNGGLEILYYHVQYSSVTHFYNDFIWIDISSNTNYTSITDLINGVPYIFRIAAINSIGSSNYSLNTLEHIPFNIVEAPYITNSEIGNNCASIFFTQSNTSGYPITKYKYTLNNGVSFFEKRGNNSSIFISNINNNTQYNIKISAYTQTGWSNLSNEISITPIDNRISEIKTDITNLNVDTINDLKNQISHDENCYLLYDNNIENDRVIVTAKCWFLSKNIIDNSTFRNDFMDNTTFFKYININYNRENLTFDMETLNPVKYTNMKNLKSNKLQVISNETRINMTELFEDKFIFKNQYSKIKLKKYKINFDGKSRIIELANGYKFKLSIDLNCADHRNEIKILEANFNDSCGALINKDVKNSITYFIPKN